MRVLVGVKDQIQRPFPQMGHGSLRLAVVSGERAVDKIKPGNLLDAFNLKMVESTKKRKDRRSVCMSES